jgi:glycosyltransferase involved in cell wall biosynthesis
VTIISEPSTLADVTRPVLPVVTVVVPVYNDWNLVPGLLACFSVQSLGPEKFEMLFVDNGSAWIPDDLSFPSGARLLRCQTPGSYAARNEAIRNARGLLLAFTDADCRPGPQWLEKGLECFERAAVPETIIAGRIVVEPESWDHMTASEMHDVALGLPQARYVQKGIATTANLFVPSKVFANLGLFDQARFSGGDAELCRRAVRRGIALRYCEEAAVIHPARRTWSELQSKRRRVVGGKITSGSVLRRTVKTMRVVLPPFPAWMRVLVATQLSLGQRLVACWVETRLWFVELSELARLLLRRRRPSRV